uniref:O-acyltransferase WSD1 C-terminal domain-containing protein n=1 Tax=Ananas comosus var. bracteatus TaxID=296719 RepID=A0A6V7QUT6_ANACO
MPSETLRNRRPLSINTMSAAATTAEAAEEVEEPVSPAGRLFHRPEFNCYIVAVIGLGRRIDDLDTIKAGLAATLARHPRFSSVPVFDESAGRSRGGSGWMSTWTATSSSPTSRRSPPPPPPPRRRRRRDGGGGLRLGSLRRRRHGRDPPLCGAPHPQPPHPLRRRLRRAPRPPLLGDGASLTSLLLACTRRAGDPSALPSLPSATPRPRPHHGRQPRQRPPRPPPLALVPARHGVAHPRRRRALAATAAFLADSPTPLKAPPSPPGDPLGVGRRRKRFVHRTTSLDDVKRVKNAMAAYIGGPFSLPQQKFDETDDVKKREKLLANLRVRSTLLVNVRPTAGIHARGEGWPKWGNWIGYVVLPIPIALYSDPLDYIRKGKEIANRKKNSWEAFFTYWCADLIVKLLDLSFPESYGMQNVGLLLKKAAATLCHRVLSNTTLSFSNIVGPVEEIEFYGYPIVYIAPSVYGHPHALTVHYQSYMNTVEMVIAVDEITIPDPHQLLDDLAESLELIKDSTETKS